MRSGETLNTSRKINDSNPPLAKNDHPSTLNINNLPCIWVEDYKPVHLSDSVKKNTNYIKKNLEEEARKKSVAEQARLKAELDARRKAENMAKAQNALDAAKAMERNKNLRDTLKLTNSAMNKSTTNAAPKEKLWGPKNRSKDIYDFRKSHKNEQKSFHEVDIVTKKMWNLELGSAIKTGSIEEDTYMLVREKTGLWHLVYIDQESKEIELDKIPLLHKLLGMKTAEELQSKLGVANQQELQALLKLKSPEELNAIYSTKTVEQLTEPEKTLIKTYIADYRKQVQHKKTPNPKHVYYFKHSAIPDSEMIWNEAICCDFYRVLAPRHVSSTKAIYSKNNYVAAVSRGIENFKSARQEPLTVNDLKIQCLDNGVATIRMLEELDNETRIKGYNLDEKKTFTCSFEPKDSKGDQKAKVKVIISSTDIKNYRIKKGLAIGLTASYLNKEDDCHANNISKYGQRIDFDMSWWPIVYGFKSSGIDWLARNPNGINDPRFCLTEYDIRHFPNIKDAQPFYWPTNPTIGESIRNIMNSVGFNVGLNSFTAPEIAVYQRLEKDPVFIYHKFAILLKYILSDPHNKVYRNIPILHKIPGSDPKNDVKIDGKPIADVFGDEHATRIQNLTQILINMPEFHEFLQTSGRDALKSIKAEFAERDAIYTAKLAEKNKQFSESLGFLRREENKALYDYHWSIKEAYRNQIISPPNAPDVIDKLFEDIVIATKEKNRAAKAPSMQTSLKQSLR